VSDASDGDRPIADRSVSLGNVAALFERAATPTVAVRGRDAPRVEVVNRAYLRVFDGRDDGSVQPRQFTRRVTLSGVERDLVQATADGTVASDELSKRTHAGRRRFQLRAIPADADGITAFLQYRDVTLRRIKDQQLAVLRRVLRHDLRNDLTVLLGYARTIADTTDDPAARSSATTMIDAATDLQRVAKSAGRMQCVTAAPNTRSLAAILPRVRRELDDDVENGVTVAETPPSSNVDNRVGIALEELCRTLAVHGDANTLTIQPEASEVWTTITVTSDASLSDQQMAAFEGKAETKLRHASGLAPWLARWAIRAAGGRVQVDERPDDGTEITVAVPTASDEAPPREPVPSTVDD